MARRAFRLVPRHGRALQSASIAARGTHVNFAGCLFSSHARFRSGYDHDVVRSDRVVATSHISTSCDRHRRRFRSGCALFWAFSGNRISARFQIVPRLIIATRPYELQRPYSTLFRAFDRDASLLESLRADRWRTARIFIAAQTTRRDYHVDRVSPVRLVRLQKSDAMYDTTQ